MHILIEFLNKDRNMKKVLTILSSAVILALPVSVYAHTVSDNNDQENHKVTICRPTESKDHPFTVVTVDRHAVHESDFLYTGPLNEHHKGDPSWCVNNQPSDVCPNLDGLQAVLPEDMVKNDKDECVTAPPVVTPPVTPPTITTTTVVTDNTPPAVVNFQGK